MKKILTVVGARPQFIKAAVVSRCIAQSDKLSEVIVHTGQHFDANMSDIFFDEMAIPKPSINLEINSMTHGAMTGRMLEELEKVMLSEKPDIVLVYGDTNSTLAGALAAKKLHIKIAHVEAGLRSFNDRMPEEINRILTDRISDILFCPTDKAVDNLHREGYENINTQIIKVGDVMNDAAKFYAGKNDQGQILDDLNVRDKKFILCTIHRQENTDDEEKLKAIAAALNQLNEQYKVVFLIHPRTKGKLKTLGITLNFEPVEPVGYFDMITLLANTALVVTDSGGLQKEAFFFKNNCVTVRNQTEWVELVENGYNVLSDATESAIIYHCKQMINKTSNFSKNLYGNGDAGEKIVECLEELVN